MYTEDKVQSIETTDETFEPRVPIELSKAGEHSGRPILPSRCPLLSDEPLHPELREREEPEPREHVHPSEYLIRLFARSATNGSSVLRTALK
jgi:hypothetical protein